MKYQSLTKWKFFVCIAFTAMLLIVFALLLKNEKNQQITNFNSQRDLVAKFLTKFHDANAASDELLQLRLVDGFMGHLQKMNQDILQDEWDLFEMNILIVFLIFIMLLIVVMLYKKTVSELVG